MSRQSLPSTRTREAFFEIPTVVDGLRMGCQTGINKGE